MAASSANLPELPEIRPHDLRRSFSTIALDATQLHALLADEVADAEIRAARRRRDRR